MSAAHASIATYPDASHPCVRCGKPITGAHYICPKCQTHLVTLRIPLSHHSTPTSAKASSN